MPGFIKNIGGSNRMRFTRPGTDPNNLNLDPNQVIFDSETIGNLSVLDYGETTVTIPNVGTSSLTAQLASWSPGYVPMVIGQIKTANAPDTHWSSVFNGRIRSCYFEVTSAGLWIVQGGVSQATSTQLNVRWTAFRFAI